MPHITAIGAHPDDLEIFMYGMLSVCQARGDTLTLIVATDGAAGGDNPGAELAARRADEAKSGLAALAAPIMLALPDGQLASHDGAAAHIREAVLDHQPDMVITHAPEDYHPDHRAQHRQERLQKLRSTVNGPNQKHAQSRTRGRTARTAEQIRPMGARLRVRRRGHERHQMRVSLPHYLQAVVDTWAPAHASESFRTLHR